jgi:hypothetical protein
MRAHIIENGVVVNTIEVESLDFMPGLVDAENGGKIGDLYENGQFTTPQPDEAVAAAAVREQRNDKLKDSDWTQVADAPVDQAAWAAYRQALRDITAQAGFPWTGDWTAQP